MTHTIPTLAETLATVPTVSQAITNYVNKVGKCSWLDLYAIFGHEEDTETHRKQFGVLLSDLCKCGHICASQPHVGAMKRENRYYTRMEERTTEITTAITPPRQISWKAADDYKVKNHPALRPGALDYQRHASRGVRC